LKYDFRALSIFFRGSPGSKIRRAAAGMLIDVGKKQFVRIEGQRAATGAALMRRSCI
jgi:hypothetical protein